MTARWLIPWLVPLAALAGPQQAASLKADADRAYVEGDYRRALTLLRAAYEADPEPGFIANQGLVLEKLGRYAEAAEALERFLATEPAPEKAAKARSVLGRIKPEVEILTEPPGAKAAEVGEEARYLGATPLRVRLAAGEHTIELNKPGFELAEITVRVEPGRASTFRQALRPLRVAPAPAPAPVPVAPVRARRQTAAGSPLGWALVGGGVLVGGASAVFYVLGSDAIAARDSAPTSHEWDEHQADAELWNVTYLAAAGVAGAAIVAGVVWLTMGGEDGPSARLGVGPGGLSVGGGW